MKRFNVGKVKISSTNIEDVIADFKLMTEENEYGYICVTNTRTSYLANRNSSYCNIQNNSLYTLPDGIPLVWIGKLNSANNIGPVSGPDLLKRLLKESETYSYSHYFYGSTTSTITKMKEKLQNEHPNVIIKGIESPPFQPIEKFDISSLAEKINKLKPTFFWCGLGAPKQELLISRLQQKLDTTICIGVGLAFEYFANTVERPPTFFQKIGLEWLFRVLQQPIKARRFIIPFFWMIVVLIKTWGRSKFRSK